MGTIYTGFVDPKSTHMDKEYDKVYPVSKNDYYRICSNYECGVRYQQWSPLQNSEPWSLCWLCADKLTNPKKYKKKKKDKKDD